jgi:predicted secreted protein with PEFG-CTERM motif
VNQNKDFYGSLINPSSMKTIAIGSIFAIFALMAIAPSAFADHAKVDVSIPAGSQLQGCEETNECYIPYEAVVDVGGEVTWINDDTAAHTVTSGTIEGGGPDGIFDSSLIMAGKTWKHTFEEVGEFPYFCVVHPWMTGIVVVQEAMTDDDHGDDMGHEEGMATAMTEDGSVMISVSSGVPTEGEELALTVEFTDADGHAIEHVNFDVSATQDGTEVLAEMGQHSHAGSAEFATSALSSDSAVDVQITMLGIGLPDDEANWSGPIGETISLNVVPEFGPIAMIVLAAAIVSIVAVTARSKAILKL